MVNEIGKGPIQPPSNDPIKPSSDVKKAEESITNVFNKSVLVLGKDEVVVNYPASRKMSSFRAVVLWVLSKLGLTESKHNILYNSIMKEAKTIHKEGSPLQIGLVIYKAAEGKGLDEKSLKQIEEIAIKNSLPKDSQKAYAKLNDDQKKAFFLIALEGKHLSCKDFEAFTKELLALVPSVNEPCKTAEDASLIILQSKIRLDGTEFSQKSALADLKGFILLKGLFKGEELLDKLASFLGKYQEGTYLIEEEKEGVVKVMERSDIPREIKKALLDLPREMLLPVCLSIYNSHELSSEYTLKDLYFALLKEEAPKETDSLGILKEIGEKIPIEVTPTLLEGVTLHTALVLNLGEQKTLELRDFGRPPSMNQQKEVRNISLSLEEDNWAREKRQKKQFNDSLDLGQVIHMTSKKDKKVEEKDGRIEQVDLKKTLSAHENKDIEVAKEFLTHVSREQRKTVLYALSGTAGILPGVNLMLGPGEKLTVKSTIEVTVKEYDDPVIIQIKNTGESYTANVTIEVASDGSHEYTNLEYKKT